MTVHDLGYRGWNGALAPAWRRPLVIATAGVRRAWQSRWLRRMLFFAWLPALWFGLGFFLWEQSLLRPELAEAMVPFIQEAPEGLQELAGSSLRAEDPAAARHQMWAWLLLSFFRYPQGFVMVMVVGLIAPPLISQDIRSRAFLLYFSRPLSRFEYLLGKLFTVWFYLVAISTLPALVLYVVGILLSPQLSVVTATWDLPLRILCASAALGIPTAALALCLSSMTEESRYAAFGWFTIWILGSFTYGIMASAEAFHTGDDRGGVVDRWSHCSLYHTLGRVQSWIFGFRSFSDVQYAAVILIIITVVSLIILSRRVTAPMRV